jgi:hypothetical protein
MKLNLPTKEQLKNKEIETYDIYTPLNGGMVHIKTTDRDVFNKYICDELTEKDTLQIIEQMEMMNKIVEEMN